MTARAKELFEASVELVGKGQVRPALTRLLEALTEDPTLGPALGAAARLCRMLGAPEDAALFEQVQERPEDPSALYDLGFRLVDQDRPDVAGAFLAASLRLRPDDVPIRRELALAQHLAQDFGGCLRTLAPLGERSDLANTELLDIELLRAEASLYLGRREVAGTFLEAAEALVPEDHQRAQLDALHLLLGRARHWPDLVAQPLRTWHFVQHGGVLLKTAGGYFEDGSKAGRFTILDMRVDMVAFLLQRLAHLLDAFVMTPELVVSASPTAAPAAHALATFTGARVGTDLAARGEARTLLLAANAAELTPFAQGLVRHRGDLMVASLNLDWTRDAAVCPDVAGVLSERLFLPWELRYSMDPDTGAMKEVPADGRDPAVLGAEVAAAAANLPDDGGLARTEFETFYRPLRDELVLGNPTVHPHRRQFTRLSPCWAERSPTGEIIADT